MTHPLLREIPTIPPVQQDSDRPFWSVMIPTYNCAACLAETLGALLVQDMGTEQMQIEVIDDCSTKDDPEAVVNELGKGRVSFFRQPHNVGANSNFNTCIKRSKGQWIHILHGDDLVLPGFYNALQASLSQVAPSVGAAFCRHTHINEQGQELLASQMERETPGILENWLSKIAVIQRIQFAAIVVKRSTYERLGGFHPKLIHAADWEMWKRIAAHYSIWYEPKILACYRRFESSDTPRLTQTGANIADIRHSIDISRAYLPEELCDELSSQAKENYAFYALSTARQMLEQENAEVAIAQIREALKCSQSLQVQSVLLATLLQDEFSPLLAEASEAIELFQHDSGNEMAIITLRQIRQHLVARIQALSDQELNDLYPTNLGQLHNTLLQSDLRYFPLTDSERVTAEKLFEEVSEGVNRSGALQVFLAVSLFYRAEQLPLEHATNDLSQLPIWFLEVYLTFINEAPKLFQKNGEVEQYYQHVVAWVDYLHKNLSANPASKLWKKIAAMFIQQANFIPLYFNLHNLKALNVKRAEILELYSRAQGYSLDHDFSLTPANRKRLKVGFLKSHFNPQTETFLTIPAFEYLETENFERILYVTTFNNHPLEEYCRSRADRFVHLPTNLQQQIEVIRSDNLDILILGMNVSAVAHPICLLAQFRLARIQATLYSTPVTTGMRHIDYYISGDLTEPPVDAEDHYEEKLVTLSGPGYCFNYGQEPSASEPKPSRAALGIPQDSIIYISGANFFKVIPEIREIWTQILAQVSNSVLVLYPFSPSWSKSYAANRFVHSFHDLFDQYSIDYSRLIILDTIPIRADVKEHLKLADIYLDSIPYTGSFSTSDPLESGIPPIAIDGNTLRSRQGPALMRELGLQEFIVDSVESYIELAIRLGTDVEFLNTLKATVKQRMAQLPRFLDSHDYSAQIGNLLQHLYHEHAVQRLQDILNLRELNIIVFPDWKCSEEALQEELCNMIEAIAHTSNPDNVTLLIDITGINPEDANLALSSVAMSLMMTEDTQRYESLELSLISQLSSRQWQALLSQVRGRVVLSVDNKEAISIVKANQLTSFTLDDLKNLSP